MAAGVDENQIFVEKVAADLVNLGLDPAADEFQIFLRYVQVPNTAEADAWRARLPLTVLRVRYNGTSDPSRPVPYPIPDYEMKTANSEADLAFDLRDLIDTVRRAGIRLTPKTCLLRSPNCHGLRDWIRSASIACSGP